MENKANREKELETVYRERRDNSKERKEQTKKRRHDNLTPEALTTRTREEQAT